jgi:hypothetical protein
MQYSLLTIFVVKGWWGCHTRVSVGEWLGYGAYLWVRNGEEAASEGNRILNPQISESRLNS